MMNTIFNDLKNNIVQIYDSRLITVSKYLHHSLKYPEVVSFFEKHKTDVQKLGMSLQSHINVYEIPNEKNSKKNNEPEYDDFEDFAEFFGPFGATFSQKRMIRTSKERFSNVIEMTKDLSTIIIQATKFEQKKLMNEMNENGGQIPTIDDVSFESFMFALSLFLEKNREYKYLSVFLEEANFNTKKFIETQKRIQKGEKNVLDELCTNLNEKVQAGKIQEVIGREDEIDQLINILSKARKNNPVLLGKAGTGKTAIAEGLAKRIVEGKVPDSLKNAVIYNLEIINIVKDTSFRGQFEKNASQLLKQFKEMEEQQGIKPILFIDELHTIMGAGSSGNGGLDFSNIIKPALARGELRTIGATTTEEWYKFINDNAALKRRFYSITINEPNRENAIKIISNSLDFYEKSHGVKYLEGTVERAVDLTTQFVIDNALPDKAFDLIDFSGARAQILGNKTVSIDDIEIALSKHKNIDIESIRTTKQADLKPLAPKLKEVIFGQDHAVEKVSKTIQKAIAGLNHPEKPYGVFLFNGPTGTGKTELAKQIAKVMNANFHRIDCSELSEPHSVSKILGSPAGYVGYDDGSTLTKVINENPRTVLLLDEFDKTHHDIQKIFLQAMDYGKLTDSKGHEINFKNVVLIMTSNFKTSYSKSVGLNNQDSKKENFEWNSRLLPEFRARLTGNSPIEFNALSDDVYGKLVDKVINEVNLNRLKNKNIKVELSSESKELIVEHAKRVNLGARPIYDLVEDKIIEPLVERILFGDLKDSKDIKVINVKMKDGMLYF